MENWILLLFSIAAVGAEHFQFPATNSCVIVDMEADFRLTVNLDTGFRGISNFNFSGAAVNTISSSCTVPGAPTLLDLTMSPFNDKLILSFQINTTDNSVHLFVYYQVDPQAHFPAIPITFRPVLDDSTHLGVGTTQNSYRCNSQQTIVFDQDQIDGFYMTMNIRNVHLQAFNVQRSTFSPAIECPQDSPSTVTTSEPTTEPDTTAPETTATETTPSETTATETTPSETTATETTPSETTASETTPSETTATETTPSETTATDTTPKETTPSETTETTPGETTSPETTPQQTTIPVTMTTPASGPARNLYVVKQDGVTCLVMEAAIVVDIQYESTDGIKVMQIDVPKGANKSASGTCDEANNENTLAIPFFNNMWSLNITVGRPTTRLRAKGSYVMASDDVTYAWKSVDLQYVEDKEHFPDAKSPSDETKLLHADLANDPFLATNSSSYKCNAHTEVEFNASNKLEITQLQYRAFGESNQDDFPKNEVVECAQDKTSGDSDDSKTVAIVIGASLGGLCLVLVVVYVILRLRRTKNGYEDLSLSQGRFHQSSEDTEKKKLIL